MIIEELEKEFEREHKSVMKLINEKIKIAAQALLEAQKISDEVGIPFTCRRYPLNMEYYPYSFNEKWDKKLREFFENDDKYNDFLSNFNYNQDYTEYGGWTQSRIC